MTDANEPEAVQTTDDAKDESATAPIRKSRWSALNRTNRIAAIILSGVAAVFVAALIFGAGVLVGTEFSDSEGHQHSETSEHQDGGDEESGSDRDGNDAANPDEQDSDSRGDGEHQDSDRQPSEGPKPSVPTTPRP